MSSISKSAKLLRYQPSDAANGYLTDANGCVAPATSTGWHFSFFMDTQRILHKLRVFAHSSDPATQELLSSDSLETKIREHANSCTHLFSPGPGQGLQLVAQPYDGKLPSLPGWPQHESGRDRVDRDSTSPEMDGLSTRYARRSRTTPLPFVRQRTRGQSGVRVP